MDAGTDSAGDSAEDGTWLTYGELAEIRGIDRHSAVKLVARHRWRRQKDNRGTLRILVPPDWAVGRDRGTDKGTDQGMDTGTDMPHQALPLLGNAPGQRLRCRVQSRP
jgi:hypothetical protein